MNTKQREAIYWRLLVALGPPEPTLQGRLAMRSFSATKEFLQDLRVYCTHNRDGISVNAYRIWWGHQQTKALQLLNRSTQHEP